MKINLNFAQSAILNKNGVNHLKVDIIPPIKAQDENQKPVLMILALDKSGSMGSPVHYISYNNRQGYVSLINDLLNKKFKKPLNVETPRTKMQHAIEATVKFINLLTPNDLFGLVSFDDFADISQPITHITTKNKTIIENNIRSINKRGCTNISNAIERARAMITAEHIENYNCKIVIISDGMANAGITEPDGFASLTLKYLQEGITLSALGIGEDYDSVIMNAISTGGGGLFHHVEDIEKLSEIFEEELTNSATATAKNVKLLLEIPKLVEIVENMNDFKQQVNGKNIEIFIGDLYSSKSIYFEIKNNFVDKDIEFKVTVEYKTLENEEKSLSTSKVMKVVNSEEKIGKAEKDQSIVDAVLSLLKNKTIRETSNSLEKGDFMEMSSTFDNSVNQMSFYSQAYNISDEKSKEVLSELDSLKEKYSTGNVSKDILKRTYAKSNRSMREQK